MNIAMNTDLKRKNEIECRLYFLVISEIETPELADLESELEEINSKLCDRCGGTGEEPGQGNNPNPHECFECNGTGYKK